VAPSTNVGLSYLLLADVGANFLRSMVSARWRDQSAWDQSETAAALAAAAAGAIHTVAAFHDAMLTSRDPALTLRAAARCGRCLWQGGC